MRISTSQIFSTSLKQLNSSLVDVTKLNAMNSSQKRINQPSDDPAGMGTVINLRAYNQRLAAYADNCAVASDYLSLADEVLSKASETVTAALELAEQGSTGTYTADELTSMSTEMKGYLETLLAIANTTMGDDSVFGGDELEDSPYSPGLGVTLTDDDLDSGDILSVTGEADSTIAVRFDSDGQVGVDGLSYSYSLDGGTTWTSGTLASGASTLDLGTCQVTLASGASVNVASNGGSQFLVRLAVLYTGSDQAMEVDISKGVTTDMTSVGSDIFGGLDAETGQAYSGGNLFEAICDCIAYLDMGDSEGVADCLEAISAGQETLLTGAAKIGGQENKISYVEASLSQIQGVVTSGISREEDADATQILVELEQANYIYEAVLSSTSQIMGMSLLDYL